MFSHPLLEAEDASIAYESWNRKWFVWRSGLSGVPQTACIHAVRIKFWVGADNRLEQREGLLPTSFSKRSEKPPLLKPATEAFLCHDLA